MAERIEELERLARLLEQGHLTKEEFDQAKAELLPSSPKSPSPGNPPNQSGQPRDAKASDIGGISGSWQPGTESELVVKAVGFESTVFVTEHQVTIEVTDAGARSRFKVDELHVPFSSISGMRFKEPGLLITGHLWIRTREGTNKDFAYEFDPHRIRFKKKQREAFRSVRDEIQNRI